MINYSKFGVKSNLPGTQKINHFLFILSLLTLSGCAIVDPTQTAMPKGIPDGKATYSFTRKEALIANAPDTVVTYSGEWRENKPKVTGSVTTNYGLSCTGQFGVAPPIDTPEYYRNDVWANGNIYDRSKLIYSGAFINYFKNSASCEAKGFGTRFTSDGEFTGEFFSNKFMKRGECKLKRSDGATYKGTCLGPTDPEEPNMNAYINVNKTTDPFLLVAGPGLFTDSQGRALSKEESDRKFSCLLNRGQLLTTAQRNFEMALISCKRNAYSGNSNCLGADSDMVRANRLMDAYYLAEKNLNYVRQAQNAKCDILDPTYLRNQALDEQKHKLALNAEREQLEQQRQAQQVTNEGGASARTSSHDSNMRALGILNNTLKQELDRKSRQQLIAPVIIDRRNDNSQHVPQAVNLGASSTLPPLPSTERSQTTTCMLIISEHSGNGKIDEEAVARNAWARGINAKSNCVERETRSGPSAGVSK